MQILHLHFNVLSLLGHIHFHPSRQYHSETSTIKKSDHSTAFPNHSTSSLDSLPLRLQPRFGIRCCDLGGSNTSGLPSSFTKSVNAVSTMVAPKSPHRPDVLHKRDRHDRSQESPPVLRILRQQAQQDHSRESPRSPVRALDSSQHPSVGSSSSTSISTTKRLSSVRLPSTVRM